MSDFQAILSQSSEAYSPWHTVPVLLSVSNGLGGARRTHTKKTVSSPASAAFLCPYSVSRHCDFCREKRNLHDSFSCPITTLASPYVSQLKNCRHAKKEFGRQDGDYASQLLFYKTIGTANFPFAYESFIMFSPHDSIKNFFFFNSKNIVVRGLNVKLE